MTTVFVLSGGGSLGAVQVGMLGTLLERETLPDPLGGTSAGAINPVYVAGRGVTVSRSLGSSARRSRTSAQPQATRRGRRTWAPTSRCKSVTIAFPVPGNNASSVHVTCSATRISARLRPLGEMVLADAICRCGHDRLQRRGDVDHGSVLVVAEWFEGLKLRLQE